MGTQYHASPKNLRPILLVINIATPDAICAYNTEVLFVQDNKYKDKPTKTKKLSQNNFVKLSIIYYLNIKNCPWV